MSDYLRIPADFFDIGLIEVDSTTLTILMLKKADTHSKE